MQDFGSCQLSGTVYIILPFCVLGTYYAFIRHESISYIVKVKHWSIQAAS